MTTVVSTQTHDDVRNKILQVLRENPFNQMDPEIPHRQIIPFASYAPWANDTRFHKIYAQVCNNTLVDLYRCWELWKVGLDLAPFEGDVFRWASGRVARRLYCVPQPRRIPGPVSTSPTPSQGW